MLYAQIDQKLVSANDVLVTQANFRCPGCGAQVRYRHGPLNVAHFAHISARCAFEAEPESAAHLMGKLQLYQLGTQIGEAQVEVVFSTIKQRADVVVEYKKNKYILEYQCSPISRTQVKQRTRAYQQLGYEVIWLLGPKYQQSKIRKSLVAKFNDALLIFYNYKTQKCTLTANFNEVDFQSLQSISQEYELDQLLQVIKIYKKRVFWQDSPTTKQVLIQQSIKIQQQLVRKNKEWLQVQQECYQVKHNLSGVPWICHPKKSMPLGLAMPHILWRSRCVLLLERYPLETIFEVSKLQNMFVKQGCWLTIDERLCRYIVNQFIVELVTNQFLTRIGTGKLELICYPEWYANWQFKTNSLKLN